MSEENHTNKNNSSENGISFSANDQNDQQSLKENSNSLNQETNDNTNNASNCGNDDLKEDNNIETQKNEEESKEIVNSSSSLFEFPTDLQPEEKKENFSAFGGFIDQPTQKTANQESDDLNKSLSGLFSGIQIKDDKLNYQEKGNQNTTATTDSTTFTFPATTQDKENKKEQEPGQDGFNFFGGFNDNLSSKNSTNSNQFQFTDSSKERIETDDKLESTENQQPNHNELQNNDNEITFHSSNEQISNENLSDYKFSGFENSNGFGFDFNSGIFSSNDNNNSFSFKFDDFPATNTDQKGEEPNNNSNNNFSDTQLIKENQTNDNSAFNPFDDASSKIAVSNSTSDKFPEFIEALNSPVFEDNIKETVNSFFCKEDSGDSLEASYKLLFKDLPIK